MCWPQLILTWWSIVIVHAIPIYCMCHCCSRMQSLHQPCYMFLLQEWFCLTCPHSTILILSGMLRLILKNQAMVSSVCFSVIHKQSNQVTLSKVSDKMNKILCELTTIKGKRQRGIWNVLFQQKVQSEGAWIHLFTTINQHDTKHSQIGSQWLLWPMHGQEDDSSQTWRISLLIALLR